jgi:hypothetical protein
MTSPGYADLLSFLQVRGISVAEVLGLTTCIVGLIMFDLFVGLSEDDAFEAISFLFLGILGVGLLLLAVAIDVQYYFLLASTSGGGLTLRVIYADLVANSLCLLRIFFC